MNERVVSERVVVVGGTSGIGLAVAERQLKEGREVVVTGRDPERLKAALDRLGEGATGAAVDARDEEAMRELFTGLGRVDHVVVAVTGTTAAVKASVEALVPVLAVEVAPARVNAVSPGIVDTPWWDRMDADSRRQAFDSYARAASAGRVGRPEDIADAIAYLIGAGFATGTVLSVDGGARLRPAAL